MSNGLGWFSDTDTEAPKDFPYQPCLQADGACLSFDIWFHTKAECDAFIREQILPASAEGMYDE